MKYSELVEKAKKEISSRKNYGNSNFMFEECKTWMESDQINLYAYWQGYQLKNIEDGIDILLVGQDWGYNPDHDADYQRKLKRIKSGATNVGYEKSTNKTNNALTEDFSYIGIDVRKYDCGKRVFFTNYSLGYRPLSAGSESKLMTMGLLKKDKALFDLLVETIKPKFIICLGREVYELVSGEKAQDASGKAIWQKHLKTGVPFISNYPLNDFSKVYGVAHPAYQDSNSGGHANVACIWRYIGEDMKKPRNK